MKDLKSRQFESEGFTLVEIIVTIVAAGILAVIFSNLLGTALKSGWNAVEIVRDESNGESVLENIIADYAELMNTNPADPDGALNTIRNRDDGTNVTKQYIDFDLGGNEVITDPTASDNLKVVFQASGTGTPAISGRHPLTIILSKTRRADDDQKIIY
jgi:prepilin-type N-terminal cleavage/methylation domain-containing protein